MGYTVDTMPVIQLNKNDRQMYSFDSSQYFVFSTSTNVTEPTQGIFGFDKFYTDNEEYQNSIYQFGMLFVAQYGLEVEYFKDE